MKTGNDLRRANVRLLIFMILFAIALTIACMGWMWVRSQRLNGTRTGAAADFRATEIALN